jgi:hypothetical protein
MERLPRDPIRFDLIDAFAKFGEQEKLSLRDPAATNGFVDRVRLSVETSLQNEALLHGLRTQSMFEAMVASLGAAEIIKAEDAGAIFVANPRLKVPDFRLILKDGTQMLVEVKNLYQGNVDKARLPFKFDRDYFDGLIQYASAMKTTLFVGIHWAAWNIWTLSLPEIFQPEGDKMALSLPNALRASHMATLGDMSIGTKFPLSLVMVADKDRPRSVDAGGSASFVIQRIDRYCDGSLIQDAVEKRIATYLMFFGKWEHDEIPTLTENQIESVEHRWSPAEDHKQGFEIVDSLSGMFSTFYKFSTQDEEKINALQMGATPHWGLLIPEDYKGKTLPLWQFKLQPA